jgi:hypothetical protein
MKTLLLNGCSFIHGWNPKEWFTEHDVVNLAEFGGSNQRTFRTTIEWIANNGNPDFVIIGLTYDTRDEMVFWNKGTEYCKYSPTMLEHTPVDYKAILTDSMVIEDRLSKVDKLFTNIIMLSGFLRSRLIPHLFVNMCERYNLNDLSRYYYLRPKIELIKQNQNIVDLEFIGNIYLHRNGALSRDVYDDPCGKHYEKSNYHILENYLNTYRIKIEQEVKNGNN